MTLPARYRPFVWHGLALLLYAAAAVWLTLPAIQHLTTHLIGHPFGDQTEYAALIAHYAAALRTGASPFWLPQYLYPAGLDATLLWAIPLQSFPAWLLTFIVPLPAAFNMTILLFMTLNGYAVWLLLRGLKLSVPAALIGGLVFTCAPAVQGQVGIGHVGLIALFPAPLWTLALLRLQTEPRRRWYALAALSGAASLWGSVLLLIYVTAPIAAMIGIAALIRRDRAHLQRLTIAGALAALTAAPFVIPFLLTIDPRTAQIGGTVQFSAPLVSAIAPSFGHPLFSGLDYPRQALGQDPFELAGYVGVIPLIAGAIAALKLPAARAWLVLAVIAYGLALGPVLKIAAPEPVGVRVDGYATFIPLPYSLIADLPLIASTRTPARFNLSVALAAAVLTGYAVHALHDRLRARARIAAWVGILAIGVIIPLDQRWLWPLPLTPAVIPPGVTALADQPGIRAVFDVPFAHPLTDKYAMYWQTAHGHPLIGGHVARRTPLDPALGWLLETTLDPGLLRWAGANRVIVHRQWADAAGTLEARARARLGDPISADADAVIFAVPDAPPPSVPVWISRWDGRDLLIALYWPGAGVRGLRVPAGPCPSPPDPTLICG